MTRRSACSQRCDVFGLCFLASELARTQTAEAYLLGKSSHVPEMDEHALRLDILFVFDLTCS